MTLGKLLQRIHMMFETTYPDALLSAWTAEMDGRILKEDYLRQGYEIEYDPTNDENTVLLLQEPWTNLYEMWLLQKIHFMRGEYDDAANFQASWNEEHTDWLKNLLMTTPVDAFGRPWLTDLAFVRRGSDGVVHMKSVFDESEILTISVMLIQNGAIKVQYETGSEQIFLHDRWITVSLPAEDTALLLAGSAIAVTKIRTVAGESYESDRVQIRVLKSALDEVTA